MNNRSSIQVCASGIAGALLWGLTLTPAPALGAGAPEVFMKADHVLRIYWHGRYLGERPLPMGMELNVTGVKGKRLRCKGEKQSFLVPRALTNFDDLVAEYGSDEKVLAALSGVPSPKKDAALVPVSASTDPARAAAPAEVSPSGAVVPPPVAGPPAGPAEQGTGGSMVKIPAPAAIPAPVPVAALPQAAEEAPPGAAAVSSETAGPGTEPEQLAPLSDRIGRYAEELRGYVDGTSRTKRYYGYGTYRRFSPSGFVPEVDAALAGTSISEDERGRLEAFNKGIRYYRVRSWQRFEKAMLGL